MRAIFISYRRDDSEGQTGRLYDDLIMHFGEESVFMDVTGIEPGRDFRRAIDEQVSTCGVLLAVIGKNWLDAKEESGRRRLDDPSDFVRLEIASAIKREIPVIPVLVRGAGMPRAEQLPTDLTELAYRNAVELTHARWDSDVQILVKALRPHVELRQKDAIGKTTQPADRVPLAKKPVPWIVAIVVVSAIIVMLAVIVTGYLRSEKTPGKTKPGMTAEAENAPAKGVRGDSVSASKTDSGSKPSPPTLPVSYTLIGTWEDDQSRVFEAVADPQQREVFEMEQIKPPKADNILWKATLKDREVEIDVFAMPSGSHQVHMQLNLSLDGNRMVGLAYPGGAGPDEEPPVSVHFRRIN